MLRQHFGTGLETLNGHGSEKKSHGGTTGDAKGQRGDQSAAFFRIVRTLRGDDATYVTLAKIRGIFFRVYRVTICKPVHHNTSQSWYGSYPNSQGAGAQNKPPVAERVLESHKASLQFLRRFTGNALATHHEIGHLCHSEQSQSNRYDVKPVP